MIRFESDDRTRGEQLFLQLVLQCRTVGSDFLTLRPDDFSHDLHGCIYRHVQRVRGGHTRPDKDAVLASMRADRRSRRFDGIAEYLEWLAGADCSIGREHVRALVAFRDAMIRQHATRESNGRGRE
jgi:hypothetical protein